MNLLAASYKRHRFQPQIITHAVWLYFRFPLSLRLFEEMLLERGIVVSYETIRRWAKKFGPEYARRLRRTICDKTILRPVQGESVYPRAVYTPLIQLLSPAPPARSRGLFCIVKGRRDNFP
jgi:transposase-like protein